MPIIVLVLFFGRMIRANLGNNEKSARMLREKAGRAYFGRKKMEMNTTDKDRRQEPPPPIFDTWGALYVFVLFLHAVTIALFYLFTRLYA